MNLPIELLDEIAIMSDDYNVAQVLKNYITEYAYWRIAKNTLVYGEVQSGKTKAIIKILKREEYKNYKKILVIQNSLLVLNQYEQRLKNEKIEFQTIDSKTNNIYKDTILVINNQCRYERLQKLINNEKYILLMDEADLVINNCPLKNGLRNYYVTATPYFMNKKIKIHNIIKLEIPKNYYGIKDIKTHFTEQDEFEIIDKFLEEKTGIMLINKYSKVEQMLLLARRLRSVYIDVPIVVLNSDKYLFVHKKTIYIKQKSINKIIDSLSMYSHIIFIADRCASRGLSYTSSDYSRHLTHQIIKIKSTIATFMQSLRICGIYDDSYNLNLYIEKDDEKEFKKYYKYFTNFKINELI